MIYLPLIPVAIIGLIAVFIFYIVPQLSRFRKTIGIDKKLAGQMSAWQRLKLSTLGLKTPLLSGISTAVSFIVAESDQFQKAGFDQFVSKEHAAMLSAVLWILTLWSHFSGLQKAAASAPVAPE